MSARSARVLIASNRGPVSYAYEDDGSVTCKRGGGGLVAGLSAASTATEVVWVCAALSEADRAAARQAPGGRLDLAVDAAGQHEGVVRMLPIDALTFHRAYNAVANSTLWFLHHLLYDTPFSPDFNEGFRKEWRAYEAYNAAFADALAEEAADGAKVVVQDYHLTLTPQLLRERRPDLRIGHFSHTPWAPPDYYRMLPDDIAVQVLEGMLGADHAGFLSPRWSRAFADCCADVLDARVRVEGVAAGETSLAVEHRGRVTHLGVHALGADGDYLRQRASEPDVETRLAVLKEQVGDCKVLLRVDRTELSKNIVRGLRAYRDLLRRYPEWCGRVVHVAFAYPSRHDLPEYREYTGAVQRIAKEIEDEFGTESWQPLVLAVDDDFARSLAAYRLADVLLVNPLRDGMNLVAKEVPVVSERGCAVVLSREAGAYDELRGDVIGINPYDVHGTADALDQALRMEAGERFERSRRLATAATALQPVQWLAQQLDALDPLPTRAW